MNEEEKSKIPEERVVWEAVLDDRYDCVVLRGEPYKGEFIITDKTDQTEILRQDVSLTYNAQFGPDVADLAVWEGMAFDAVERHERPEDSDER